MPFNISIHFLYIYIWHILSFTFKILYEKKISFRNWSGVILRYHTIKLKYNVTDLAREREREKKNAKQRSNRKWAIKINDKTLLANFKRNLLLFSVILFVCLFDCVFLSVEISFSRGTNLKYTCLFIYSILLPFRGLLFHHNDFFCSGFCCCCFF